jgi:ribosomal protein L33
MICTCPKCAAEVLFEHSQIKEEGTSFTCPACRASFWICAEATVRGASRQEVKVYCTTCGKKLKHLAVCSGCGLMLPGYYVVQWVKKVRKNQGTRSTPRGREEAANAIPQKSAQKSALSAPKSIGAVAVALIALLVLGTALHQKQKKAEQIFVTNFIRVIYCVHTGSDLSLKQCAKFAGDWEAAQAAGKNSIPGIKLAAKSRLIYVKNETDEIMGKIAEPPRKYVTAKDNLDTLYATYRTLHVVTLAPAGSLPEFTAAVDQAERAYKLAAEQLKANLPEEMSAALSNAKKKYMYLRDF